jgi:hypothetical protein
MLHTTVAVDGIPVSKICQSATSSNYYIERHPSCRIRLLAAEACVLFFGQGYIFNTISLKHVDSYVFDGEGVGKITGSLPSSQNLL